ncbi:hypothetical protein SARC_16732, partial [Sphaeroforma arctica JP610]
RWCVANGHGEGRVDQQRIHGQCRGGWRRSVCGGTCDCRGLCVRQQLVQR